MTAHKRSLGQGNVFTPVCDSVHRGGVSAPLHAGIHLAIDRPAPGRHTHTHPPWADIPSLGRSPFGYYRIWTTSGRYTSYWNAYFFGLNLSRSLLYKTVKYLSIYIAYLGTGK